MADPGFPVGGIDFVWGGVDSQSSHILKILCVKTKESGPFGGGMVGERVSASGDGCLQTALFYERPIIIKFLSDHMVTPKNRTMGPWFTGRTYTK